MLSLALTFFADARQFARSHDDRIMFHLAFVCLTVLSALFFNLGFFGLLILAHMTLDYVKYRDVHRYPLPKTFRCMLQESLVDIALFCTSLAFSVYVQHSSAAVTLSTFWHLEVTLIELLGVVAPRLAIMQHVLCVFSNVQHYLETIHPSVKKGWSYLDTAFLLSAVFALLLIASAPALLGVDSRVIALLIRYELQPF